MMEHNHWNYLPSDGKSCGTREKARSRNYNVERGIPGSEMHIHGTCLTIRNRFRLLPEILFQFLATETSEIKLFMLLLLRLLATC